MATFTIEITGIGGEIVLGEISPEQFDYWQTNELGDYFADWLGLMAVPEELQICNARNWFECDSITHETGIECSNLSNVLIKDDQGNQIWHSLMGMSALSDAGISINDMVRDRIYAYDDSWAQHVFKGRRIDRGLLFAGTFQSSDFIPNKLSFNTIDVEGWELVHTITYDKRTIYQTQSTNIVTKNEVFEVFKVNR